MASCVEFQGRGQHKQSIGVLQLVHLTNNTAHYITEPIMFNCSIQFSVLITKHYIICKNVLMIKYKPILQVKNTLLII